MNQLIECVPNFSEGRNMGIIGQIADEIRSVKDVKLLNIDPGKATNRTVITFIGNPKAVVEAAFLAIKKASELIDMSRQSGEHPRIGATDVCPLIPVSGISMEETVEYAKKLGYKVGKELGIPVFLYEAAQPNKERSNLAVIRSGEYEGLFKKIRLPEWKPDFGPAEHSIRSGSTVIGARDFLVAYNINLNTTSTQVAKQIAAEIRESGGIKREGNPITGKILTEANGKPIKIPGILRSVKAIGWFIEEYGAAQISMNLTNINITPVHIAFEEVNKKAREYGVKITGSELIGLIPLQAMLEAGRYFLKKQGQETDVSDNVLIQTAILSLGLNELSPFKPEERIIEYLLQNR